MNNSNEVTYNLFKAEPYLCVPTILYVIITREFLDFDLDFYQFANHFKYNLPPQHKNLKLENVYYTENESLWGMVPQKDTINNLFKLLTIPLCETYIPINTITDWNFIDEIRKYLNQKCHIIFGYDYLWLYEKMKSNIGHVSIVNNVINDDKIAILNPGPDNYGLKIVDTYDLLQSIKMKKDGLWIISKL